MALLEVTMWEVMELILMVGATRGGEKAQKGVAQKINAQAEVFDYFFPFAIEYLFF